MLEFDHFERKPETFPDHANQGSAGDNPRVGQTDRLPTNLTILSFRHIVLI
jgi:hypothetical protein